MNAPLGSDTLSVEASKIGKTSIEPAFLNILRQHNYPVEGVESLGCVRTEGSEIAHLVMIIETLNKPLDNPECDAVEDKTYIPVCDCGDYTYRKAADIADGETPSESGLCKHLNQFYQELNRDATNTQTEANE